MKITVVRQTGPSFDVWYFVARGDSLYKSVHFGSHDAVRQAILDFGAEPPAPEATHVHESRSREVAGDRR